MSNYTEVENIKSGIYVYVTVEVSEPVITDEQLEALTDWVEDNVREGGSWEDYYWTAEDLTEWQFRYEFDPDNYYDG